MHPTTTCKLKSGENFFSRQFYPQNCDFAIFVPKFTHDWQVNSVCCKNSPYEQAKEFNEFQFYYFPFKPEKTQIKMYAFRNELGHEKMCLMSYANNKGADQPAHPHSLISTFVICCLDSIISLDSIAEISRLKLASVAAQAGLCLAWSETPEDTFCHVVAQIISVSIIVYS